MPSGHWGKRKVRNVGGGDAEFKGDSTSKKPIERRRASLTGGRIVSTALLRLRRVDLLGRG